MAWLENQDSDLSANRAALETTVQNTFTKVQVPSTLTIPVIFHILYNEDAERVSEAQIYNQLDALNRDFGFTSSSFTHEALTQEGFDAVSNHIGIEFCLPQFGSDSIAINYYPVARKDWQFDNAMKNTTTQGVLPWNPQQFLNIYIVDLHDTLAVAGYAQMPGAADSTDAIVIDYRFVGNAEAPYDMGRTLVHLVGNWMGVYSIWGVDDQHLSSCQHDKLVVEQTMNFMDSSDDACLSMWTTGQKYRFFAFLQAARGNLIKHTFSCESRPNNIKPELVQNKISPTVQLKIDPTQFLADGVKVYPNPARTYIQLQLSLKLINPISIQVTDLNGQLIYQQQTAPSTGTIRLATADWLTGIYLLSIHQNGQLIHAEKVAIQH